MSAPAQSDDDAETTTLDFEDVATRHVFGHDLPLPESHKATPAQSPYRHGSPLVDVGIKSKMKSFAQDITLSRAPTLLHPTTSTNAATKAAPRAKDDITSAILNANEILEMILRASTFMLNIHRVHLFRAIIDSTPSLQRTLHRLPDLYAKRIHQPAVREPTSSGPRDDKKRQRHPPRARQVSAATATALVSHETCISRNASFTVLYRHNPLPQSPAARCGKFTCPHRPHRGSIWPTIFDETLTPHDCNAHCHETWGCEGTAGAIGGNSAKARLGSRFGRRAGTSLGVWGLGARAASARCCTRPISRRRGVGALRGLT